MSNVKKYTTEQLVERIKGLKDFTHFPKGHHLVGVRSNEDAFNEFDDKFYLFKGEVCLMVFKGTTNPGKQGLLNFSAYNSEGVAVLKADVINYDVWAPGMHRGKVWALRQVKGMPYFRDGDKDKKSEQLGKEKNDIIYANFHPATYLAGSQVEKRYIDGWSLGCQVTANRADFDKAMTYLGREKTVTYTLLNEF